MIHRNALAMLAAFACVALIGCEKKPSEEQKSLSYFSQHPDEAGAVADKCKTLEMNELSRMPPSQRFAWEETGQGVNCKNAVQARADSKYSDYQKRMREEAKKYQ